MKEDTRPDVKCALQAFIYHDSKWLFFKEPEKNEWFVLGGRLKKDEDIDEGLIREIKEELGENVNVEIIKTIDAHTIKSYLQFAERFINLQINQRALMKFHDIKVNRVITSEDAKSYKPRPEIFKLALEKLGLKVEDVLLVGDSITSDIIGSQKFGMKAAWINRKNREIPKEINPDIICSNLIELIPNFFQSATSRGA